MNECNFISWRLYEIGPWILTANTAILGSLQGTITIQNKVKRKVYVYLMDNLNWLARMFTSCPSGPLSIGCVALLSNAEATSNLQPLLLRDSRGSPTHYSVAFHPTLDLICARTKRDNQVLCLVKWYQVKPKCPCMGEHPWIWISSIFHGGIATISSLHLAYWKNGKPFIHSKIQHYSRFYLQSIQMEGLYQV